MAYADKAKERENRQRFYYRDLEKSRANGREYARLRRLREPEKVRAESRKTRAKNYATIAGRARNLLTQAKRRALQKGLPCTITLEWVLERLNKSCEATGLPFDFCSANGRAKRGAFAPSIDRKNAAQGYTPENSRVIVWGLNAALGIWGDDVLRKIVLAWVAR